jgi:segregation and condensation protein B
VNLFRSQRRALDNQELKSIVEGLIFVQSDPSTVEGLSRVLEGISAERIQTVINELEDEYRVRGRGFVLSRVAGGYQFRSLPSVAPWILEMKRIKPAKLSRASLETLSIIAYNQPITRNNIEQIRGVESSAIIRNLMERDLVIVVGKKDIPGRPLLYGTSKRFLEIFGLADLASLPALPDIEKVSENDSSDPSSNEE